VPFRTLSRDATEEIELDSLPPAQLFAADSETKQSLQRVALQDRRALFFVGQRFVHNMVHRRLAIERALEDTPCRTAPPRTPQGPNVMAQTLTWLPEREGPGGPAPTAPERGASDDSTAETTKEAEEQRAMFAASRAVAEGDLQAAYRIACGAPRPMAVARHILELLKKLHPAPGDHLPEGQTPYGPPKRVVPKHIPITVDMSTLETVLGDLNLRSAPGRRAGRTGLSASSGT
jgi:hypothetical protein